MESIIKTFDNSCVQMLPSFSCISHHSQYLLKTTLPTEIKDKMTTNKQLALALIIFIVIFILVIFSFF